MALFAMPPREIVILSANNYDSEDISGCSVFYTFDTTMEEVREDINTVGNIPAKVWGPKELFQQIPCAPAKYEAEFTMKMKKNAPMLYLQGVRYLNRVKLVDDIYSSAPPEGYYEGLAGGLPDDGGAPDIPQGDGPAGTAAP